jgi:hypothetical protein
LKTSKVLGGAALGLIGAVAVVAYFLVSNLDAIIEDVIEQVGSEVTQTRVSLNNVEIDLSTGEGRLTGLTIANPPGYDSDYAFELDDIVVAIAPASLTKPVIVISQVKIDGASLIAEQKGTRTNLSELLDNIESGSAETQKQAPGESEEPAASPLRLMIENFAFINTQATLVTEEKGENSLKIPDVRRSNIGNKETGLSPEELAQQILGSVVKEVERAVGKYLGKLAADAVEKKLTEDMSESDKSKLDGLKSLFKKD